MCFTILCLGHINSQKELVVEIVEGKNLFVLPVFLVLLYLCY